MARIVTDYLDEIAKLYPKKNGYIDKENELPFLELKEKSRCIATWFINNQVFKKPIMVYMDKCVDVLISFMGCAYSGNFYTPIDVDMPIERVKNIFETLKPKFVITHKKYSDRLKSLTEEQSQILLFDELVKNKVDNECVENCCRRIIDTDVLYVFFTSGSTGIPKGVIINHRSVIDYTDWFVGEFDINSKDILGNQSPLYFDLSIQDVYATIKTGCTTYLINKDLFSYPKKLIEYMNRRRINVIMWAPSALCLVANASFFEISKLPPLRLVAFCGEVMPNKHLNIWRKAFPKSKFVNLYGPTEACDACAYYIINREFDDSEPLPIGQACGNTDIIVLNDHDELIGEDEVGELCIRGSSLAYGYYNSPEKTKNAFTQNPINDSYREIIYRTGDMVKYNEYGELMYIGRKDFQVKVSGYRIELGEIETSVSSVKGVESNCCIYDEENQLIVLVYVGEADKKFIRTEIRKKIPKYMMPHKYIKLEKMPLNQNGKIDRAELKNILKIKNS